MRTRSFLLVGVLLFGLSIASCGKQAVTPEALAGTSPSSTGCPGCSPTHNLSEVNAILLTPYQTRTPSPSPSGPPPTATLLPTATPTPVTYIVKGNDDMFGISLRYGISLQALQTANPSVNPNYMSVGQKLVIPVTVTPAPPGKPGEATATPALMSVQLSEPVCYPSADGGLWCLVNASLTGKDALETVTARIKLAANAGEKPVEGTASAPIDVLNPGQSLPLVVFFPAPAPRVTTGEAVMLTALPVNKDLPRYINAKLSGVAPEVAGDGLSARVTGNVILQAGETPAQQIWVAALAYDHGGRPVGIRKWEYTAGLKPGETLPFDIIVYSLGPKIDQVDVQVEARR